MSIKVDPTQIDELSLKLKGLGDGTENGERRVHQSLYRFLQDLRGWYAQEREVQRALDAVEDSLREVTDSARILTSSLHQKAKGLTQASQAYLDSEEKVKKTMQQHFALPSSYYGKSGALTGDGAAKYLKDPLFEDPVVQKLHQQALHGTEEEKQEAKQKLDTIFKARYDIGRAQVAYSVYKAFNNKPLMEGAHKEAERLRKVLKGLGIDEKYYGNEVKLSHLFSGAPIQACSYDPSFSITKDGKFIPVEMPKDNQYIYLLGLIMKGGKEGAWAKSQLGEIHKLLTEIGRSQTAWHEYKAKNMQKEMDGAHAYAEKLRTALKTKYSLSSEMVDDVDYRELWMGVGPAGKWLVEKHEENVNNTVQVLDTADEYRQAIIEEAKYWIGKIPYCRNTIISTQVLDKDNPPPYMDCADFTSSLYKTLLNIDIGPNTSTQINRGTKVAIKDLKQGDLILFGNKKSGAPSHVGMYIGNGEFIHLSGNNTDPNNLYKKKSWNVRIDKLSNSYWNPKIITGRRIIQDNDTIINKPNKNPIPLPRKETKLDSNSSPAVSSPTIDKVETGNYSFEKELAKFPESYRPMLQKLHKQHPTWRFYADMIKADFNSLVDAEWKSEKICTMEENFGYVGKWRNPKFKYDKGYFAASKQGVAYFIDPRNFIDETQIFQFLSAKYDKNTQNLSAVEDVLKKGRLSGKSSVFVQAGGDKVSAVFLAAKSTVETNKGNSKLAKGSVTGYQGWYNMYGIGATDGDALAQGAKTAKKQGWDTQDKAIIGGGNWIYKHYVSIGQDTLYKMKWNIEAYAKNGTITHQYATHIKDAYNKAYNFAQGVKEIDAPLVFRIPVYQNMPSQISAMPKSAQAK
ncbi:hypothetical protein J25TS5_28250 [Paenibacillus faecis]|uniref:NlpC/P60 family protein n=1 Tax=Paenibacillus faecis TaxID=862114 RepID=UPI001B1DCF1C|nr:NlpC/P60 family protein [Paenibacillus faecis]GIO85893.1 hypothetical protein J25TS5_28250 [Paenibacillus faecis]